MNPSIRAVLFDADGVIIHPCRFRAWLEREHGITPAMTAPFFDGVFSRQCLVGRFPLADALAPYLPGWGWRETPGAFIAAWLAVENAPDERMLAAVASLRRAGYTACLATSQEPNRAAYLRTVMGFEALFDRLFISCEMGCQKPEAEYFRRIEADLGLNGGQLLFWDDNPGLGGGGARTRLAGSGLPRVRGFSTADAGLLSDFVERSGIGTTT